METPCCALPRGTNMAGVKQEKHLSLSFAIETKNYYSRVLTHRKEYFFSCKKYSVSKNVDDNCSFDLT